MKIDVYFYNGIFIGIHGCKLFVEKQVIRPDPQCSKRLKSPLSVARRLRSGHSEAERSGDLEETWAEKEIGFLASEF